MRLRLPTAARVPRAAGSRGPSGPARSAESGKFGRYLYARFVAEPTTLTELADGVWAWLQPGGETGVSNAGVIADDDGLTIVDTLMVRSQWEPFAAAVKSL